MSERISTQPAYRDSVNRMLSAAVERKDETVSPERVKQLNEQRLLEKRSVLKQAVANIIDLLTETEVDQWLADMEKTRQKSKLRGTVVFSWGFRS
jgi:predicted transcriptional regulator